MLGHRPARVLGRTAGMVYVTHTHKAEALLFPCLRSLFTRVGTGVDSGHNWAIWAVRRPLNHTRHKGLKPVKNRRWASKTITVQPVKRTCEIVN